MPVPYLVNQLDPHVSLGQPSLWDGGFYRGANFTVPPIEYGGYIYVFYSNLIDPYVDNFDNDVMGVSSSPDGVVWTVLDSANAPRLNAPQSSLVYWILDIANTRALGVYQRNDTGEIEIVPFNLSANGLGSYGSPITSNGVVPHFLLGNDRVFPWFTATMINATTFLVVYDEYFTNGGFSAGDSYSNVKATLWNGSSWSSPLTIFQGQFGPQNTSNIHNLSGDVVGACVDGSGISWVFYFTADVYYTFPQSNVTDVTQFRCARINSTGALVDDTLVSTTLGTAGPGFSLFAVSSVPRYLASVNKIIFPTICSEIDPGVWSPAPPVIPNCWFLITSSASGPSFTFELIDSVYDFEDSEEGPPYFFTNADESRYYVAICHTRNAFDDEGPLGEGWEQIITYTRAASDTSWTGPTVFFDNELNQLLIPPYHINGTVPPPAELNSIAMSFRSNGQMMGTCGMLNDFCGSEFFVTPTFIPPNPCAKFKLYANSRIEFIGFGEDQIKAFNLMPINQQMLLPVAKPRLGKWNLSSVAKMRSGGQGDLL
jgi:hypothetical protein